MNNSGFFQQIVDDMPTNRGALKKMNFSYLVSFNVSNQMQDKHRSFAHCMKN